MFIGVDACKLGWFAVGIDGDGDWSAHVYGSAQVLLDANRNASMILTDTQERLCDLAARKSHGPKRGSSVFPAPCRPALSAESYAQASAVNRQHTGRGLSKQSWAIAGKIREVDDLLDGKPFGTHVREFHPEVCFAGLADGRPMTHAKKRTARFQERMDVLRGVYGQTDEAVEYALATWKRKEVARDDIVDALAGAVMAYLGQGELRTLPDEPETDARGRPMEIVYWSRSD
jgi:predicted RNase H-like nuclease